MRQSTQFDFCPDVVFIPIREKKLLPIHTDYNNKYMNKVCLSKKVLKCEWKTLKLSIYKLCSINKETSHLTSLSENLFLYNLNLKDEVYYY